ncbi:MAG: Rab family GTPase [Candidatus Hodarchaeales archaeon]|jgi:small GTP-binding protein
MVAFEEFGNSLTFKVILLGSKHVGKTSIRFKYLGTDFNTEFSATIGVEYSTKKITRNDQEVGLQIWDLQSGQSLDNLRSAFYSGASAGLIVYDVTDKESLESIKKWKDDFIENNGSGDQPIVIIGNKIDVREDGEPTLSPEEGREIADDFSIESQKPVYFMEASAITGENIDQAFQYIVDYYLKSQTEDEEVVFDRERVFT